LRVPKGETEFENVSQRSSSSERTLVHFAGAFKKEMSSQNSPWKTCKVMRTIRHKGVVGQIRVGRNHSVGSRIQQRSLIVTIELSRLFR
jgi:hypothetical protein